MSEEVKRFSNQELFKNDKKETKRFSNQELMKNDVKEKNTKAARATKRAMNKVDKEAYNVGKYTVRVVDGIKYMTLN